jgi:hypothetical protein
MTKRKGLFLFPLLALILLSTGCADVEAVRHAMTGHTYGFFGGLWHGLIFFFSFLGSLFSDNIAVYAVNNSGGWYDFGFLMGAMATLGGGSTAGAKKCG